MKNVLEVHAAHLAVMVKSLFSDWMLSLALIAFLQGEPMLRHIVGKKCFDGPTKLKAAHAINYCEMYYHFLRQNDQATADIFRGERLKG